MSEDKVVQAKRYHTALVTLHWLLALMLIAMLAMGALVVKTVPNRSPDKISALRGHMIGDALPPRAVHGIVAKLLMLAVGLHIAAALYHQFIRRDGLLSRMGFGQR